MIEVRNLTKLYPGVIAVDNITFDVQRGEIVGFLGPNGAGKTTTMRILTCFMSPTAGSVRIAGMDVLTRSMEVRRRVGYQPENNPLYMEMRVSEYLDFRARLKGVARSDRTRAVDSALNRCGLSDVRARVIAHLSKGYKQRIGMADAIVNDPEIVILDEPTIGMDPHQVRQVRELVRQLGEKHTVILSTHILSEVEKVCGRVLIINRGRLVADGTPVSIVNRLTVTGRVRLEVRGVGEEIKQVLEAHPGVKTVIWNQKAEDYHIFLIESIGGVDLRLEIFRCAAQKRWDVLEVGLERTSLEDAFVELTMKPLAPVAATKPAEPDPAPPPPPEAPVPSSPGEGTAP